MLFATGMLICRKDSFIVLADKAEKILPILISASVLYFGLSVVVQEEFSYFSRFALAAHIINILLFFGLAGKILKIFVDESEERLVREAVITITAEGLKKTVKVRQLGI